MANDIVPTNHDDFKTKLEQFEAWLVANGVAFGIPAGEITAFTALKNTAVAKLPPKKAADIVAVAANSDLVTAEKAVTVPWRNLSKRLQPHPNMTDPIRIAAGLTVPDLTRTPRTVGDEVPAVHVVPGIGKLVIHWGTMPTNEQLNTKPAWADGANIYITVGTAPEMLAGFDRASPFKYIASGPPASITVRAAYRGPKEDQIGGKSAPVAVGSGGIGI